ncbi:MAG: NUDIX hydrolase [Chroococcales cyanobacterium]
MNKLPVTVAIAILSQNGQFLMQLRDNIPGIIFPGHWGFFGGHLEPGENPEEALKRELFEEIGYNVPESSLFRTYTTSEVIRHVFHVPLTVTLDALELYEGWDMALFTPAEIEQGSRYSPQANQVCPLGIPHQQIMLDFIETMVIHKT